MASDLKNHQGSQGTIANNGVPQAGDLDAMISLSKDHLREIPLFLRYNHPFCTKNNSRKKIERRRVTKEYGKKHLTKMEMMRSNWENSTIDLDLKLSPPGVNKKNKLFRKSVSAPTLSCHSCMPKERSPNNAFLKSYNLHEPSLILKGCQRCYMYIMVSKSDPKCPNCNGKNFIDVV